MKNRVFSRVFNYLSDQISCAYNDMSNEDFDWYSNGREALLCAFQGRPLAVTERKMDIRYEWGVRLGSEAKKGDVFYQFKKIVYSETRTGRDEIPYECVKVTKDKIQLRRRNGSTFFITKLKDGKPRRLRVLVDRRATISCGNKIIEPQVQIG